MASDSGVLAYDLGYGEPVARMRNRFTRLTSGNHPRRGKSGIVAALGVLGIMAISATGCAKKETTTESQPPDLTVAAGCPAMPKVHSPLNIWPDDESQDLVPSFDSLCATPTHADLFGLLNESAMWAGELEATALGILHRDEKAIATFSVARINDAAIDESKAALESQGATSDAGDMTLTWARGGSHTLVLWIDGNNLVALSAASEREAVDATSEWMAASNTDVTVRPPDEIPEQVEIPAALEGGPPLEDLPDGYLALVFDPFSFMGSDFADEITIFDNRKVKAMGAAIILSENDSDLIGTVIAREGSRGGKFSKGISDYKKRISTASGSPADGFIAGQTDALVVGHDEKDVEVFTRAWEKAAS